RAGAPGELGAVEVQPRKAAEDVVAQDGQEGRPGGEDDQGHGQPARGLDGAVSGPGARDVVHGVIQSAQAGDARADTGRQILVAGDVDAGGVGGGGVVTVSPQGEPWAGAG